MAFSGAAEHAHGHRIVESFGRPSRDADLHRLETVVESKFMTTREVRRQIAVELDVHNCSQLTVQKIGEVSDNVLEGIHGETDMTTVEMTAVEDILCFGVHNRVVVCAVHFDFNELAE